VDHKRKKIMHVDNAGFGLMSVKKILENRYEVSAVTSADMLPGAFKDIKPDLILLDVNTPGAGGLELNGGCYAGIPVVAVTGKKDKESAAKAPGAAAYVSKPFSNELLVETIENVISPVKGKNISGSPAYDGGKPRVLSVDDVPNILRAIDYALRDKYNVYTLSDPEKLKDFLQRITPDLFLLDYRMPGLSGFDLIPIIRAFPEHRETPVIFLTSIGTEENMKAAMELGACDYIEKPFEPKELRAKIEKYLRRV